MTTTSTVRAASVTCLLIALGIGPAVLLVAGCGQDDPQSQGRQQRRQAATSQPAGHGAEHATAPKAKRVGDPYLLAVDPVTGAELPAAGKQVIVQHEGRELRFGDERSAQRFKASPDTYLADVDQRLVAQQLPHYPLETCVVSGEKLGDMGNPIDFVYSNRLVRFCCKSCRKTFLEQPDKYLDAIDEAAIDRQEAHYALKTCLVSGEDLGTMGAPIDRVMGNRLVRFCCKGCITQFRADPLTYLAQLDKAVQSRDGSEPAPTSQPRGEHHDENEDHSEHEH